MINDHPGFPLPVHYQAGNYLNNLPAQALTSKPVDPSERETELIEKSDPIKAIIEERGKVYGDPLESHTNIGLAFTALLQQHYGITLDHPVPASLVAQMMIAFKNQRSAKTFKADNYLDLAAYARFAEEFQKAGK